MAKLSPQGPFRAFDENGDPLNGGLLYTYEAGTTTPKVTYTDEGQGTENTNPVELDAEGYANVWLGDGAYKLILKDSADVTQWSIDDVVGDASQGFAAAVIDQGTNLIVTAAYASYFINATAAITLSLLPAGEAGDGFYFTAKASNGAVIIDPDGSETIDGASTKTIAAGGSALIVCNGSVWYTAFYNTSADFSGGSLILPQATVPAQTAEGSVVWDTDNDLLTIGDGAGRKTMVDTSQNQTIAGNKSFTGTTTFTQNVDVSGTASEAGYINIFEDTDNGTNKAKLQAPAVLASDVVITLPNETCTLPIVTSWAAFTPTYTGFGTVSVTSFFWRRVGDTMEIMGKFTAGTSTATEARLSLPNSVTIDSTKVPSIRRAGGWCYAAADASQGQVLIESSVGYITFGIQSASQAGLTKQLGNAFTTAGSIVSLNAVIPITGW